MLKAQCVLQNHAPSSIHLHPALCNNLNNIRTKIPHVIGQFPKFRPKNSKLSILTENWFTWYLGGADSEYRLRISKFRPQTPFLGKFGPKRTKLSVLSGYWHAWYLKDADAYSYISFVNFQTKIHFRQIWAKKVKVVRFVWKLTHMVPRGWWFLFQELFSGFQTKNRFLVIFRPKKSNLCILVEDGTHGISRNRILIPKLVFWISKPKFILGQSEFPEVKLPVLSDVVTQRILRVLICFNWNL